MLLAQPRGGDINNLQIFAKKPIKNLSKANQKIYSKLKNFYKNFSHKTNHLNFFRI